MKTKWYLIGILLFLFPATLTCQSSFIDMRYQEQRMFEAENKEDVIYIPLDAAVLRLFAPADTELLADLLWMRTTYYFGYHALKDRSYPYLLYLLELITDISPEWKFPFLFGAIILPTEADATGDGIYLIEKGLKHHPDYWNLWFYKGYYLWQSQKDYEGAAYAFHQASILPNAPFYLGRLSATFATRAGQKQLALHFLEESLRNISDPIQRKSIIKKMEEVMAHDQNSSSVE